MKKIYIYISLFAFAAITLGCSKEVDVQDELPDKDEIVATGDGETITVTLSVPESEETKTFLGTKDGSSYPVKWSTNDPGRISLNGSAPTSSNKDSDTQITASFKPTSGLSVYNFLYRGDSGHDNQVTIPASQTYYANDFDDAAMPMYATSATRSNSVTFSHLCSLLKFSLICTDTDHLPSSKGIDSVTLTAEDENMSLSGTFTIGKTGAGLLNGTLTPASGGASLTYSFGSHKSLSSTPFVFYVAIPAGTYEGGIKLTIVDNNGGSMDLYVMTEASKKTIEAGKVREFETVDYVPAAEANLIMIYDDTSFLKFVNAVAGGNKTVNARVTKNTSPLELSAETVSAFNSIQGYKGIFDGNNKAIKGLDKPLFDDLQGVVKNLTLNSTISATATDNLNWGIFARQIVPSIEVDDAPGLQNCTTHEESSITFAPASALSGNCQVGGLVGNNRGGTISNCTNKATVTLAGSVACGENGSSTDKAQPSIGGVVGRTQKGGDLKTQGDISNCGNEGDVIYSGNWIANVYIGGVVGYQVEKAESISGCTNSGLVKAASSAVIGGSLHIGGVIGMGKGLIETCSNTADGEVVTEACSVQSYLNQGGVVGRINRGEDSYTGLSNAGTIEVAATGNDGSGNWIGGVVGRCSEGATLTGLTNSGSINCTATSNTNTFIGGITARLTTSLSDSNSTGGAITYSGSSESGALYVGGVTAYTKEAVTISNCTSAMTINVGGDFTPSGENYYGTGGIIGNLANDEATVSNCLNTGSITWGQKISGKGYSYLGGVVGRAQGSISNSSNGGTITFSGKNQARDPFIGGVAGDTATGRTVSGKYSSATASNYGNIFISTSVQSSKYVYVGGITGRARSTISDATNAGQINVTNLTCTRFYLGGIAGTNTVALGSGCANLADGDITVSGLTVNEYYYIGGVVGLNSAAVTGNNAGDVIVTNGSTSVKSLFLGGVVGRGEANISSCTNTGAVSNGCPVTTADSYLQVGGVVGYNNGSSEVSSCHNTGNVSNSGDCNGYLYIGGITSEADALVSNCDNTGDVTNSGNSGNGKWIAIGGVVGFLGGANLTSCSNGGTVSNSGTSNEDVCIGGVVGTNDGYTLTTCYNSGAVNNSGNSNDGYNVSVGGLVGWSSDNSVYVTCYNEGDVENSGNGSNTSATAPGARVAGLIASASGANTISGDADNYNYNNGEVYEHSASARAAVGGVCAWANNASTSLDYARNLSGGVIWVEDGEYTNVYVGGVLGVETAAASFNYTKNAGKIGIRNITISKAAYIGGVHGGFTANGAQTITGCENTGAIDCPDSGGKSENMKSTSSAYIVTYVGGVSSGAGNDGAITGKTFTNCINRGAITMYNQCWTRLGGVVGYANQNPSGCENHGKIVYYRKAGGYNSSSGAVGGVVGYINIATVSNLTNTGGVQTTGSSPNCYTGGIVGSGGTNMNKMTNCNVGKSGINIVGSGNAAQVAGLFASSESGSKAWTFTGCKVMSGTKCRGTEVTDANMETYVIGRGAVPSSITDPPVVVTSF